MLVKIKHHFPHIRLQTLGAVCRITALTEHKGRVVFPCLRDVISVCILGKVPTYITAVPDFSAGPKSDDLLSQPGPPVCAVLGKPGFNFYDPLTWNSLQAETFYTEVRCGVFKP